MNMHALMAKRYSGNEDMNEYWILSGNINIWINILEYQESMNLI